LALAKKVADQLMQHDALAAHARDELGLSAQTAARPIQAALASAGSFATGAIIPWLVAAAALPRYLIGFTVAASLLCLLFLGGVSARAGGADVVTGALRVALWSALAMAVTAGVGALLGTAL
jgi:VIT1/CCC1 family predicted Fe2+/Mn2+ transporter